MTGDLLTRAEAAKADYRDDPSDETRAEHRQASEELRYARWVERGGPAEYERAVEDRKRRNEALAAAGLAPDPETPLRGADLYARWTDENPEG